MRHLPGMTLAFLVGLSAPAFAGSPEPEPPPGPLRMMFQDTSGPTPFQNEPVLPGQIAPPDAVGAFEKVLSTAREFSQNWAEFRLGGYVWYAVIKQMEGKSSQKDLRRGRQRGFTAITNVRTRDFLDDFHIDRGPYTILNPEAMLRLGPSAFRLSWWMWSEDSGVVVPGPSEYIAFGDRTYDPGTQVDGSFVLMDTKFIYEYRVWSLAGIQFFAGLSLHYLRYQAEFKYLDDIIGWDKNGAPIGAGSDAAGNPLDTPPGLGVLPRKPPETHKPWGDYGLATISVRIEGRLVEGVFLVSDTQAFYIRNVPIGGGHISYGYSDLKLGVWAQFTKWIRVGAGARYWQVWAEVHRVGRHKTDFEGRAELQGVFAGIFLKF